MKWILSDTVRKTWLIAKSNSESRSFTYTFILYRVSEIKLPESTREKIPFIVLQVAPRHF